MGSSLYQRSIEIILRYQDAGGAYVASPNFPNYAYCWLRDGSFIAHSMDRAGEYESARHFFRWVGRTLEKHATKVDRVAANLAAGNPLKDGDFLHTRYTLNGEEGGDDANWGNFQYDGYGTWLWALAEHIRLADDQELAVELAGAIRLTARYLSLVWKLPGYDCWEEHPEYLHPYSLAAAYAGLQAAVQLAGKYGIEGLDVESLKVEAERLAAFVKANGVKDGRLVKSFDPEAQTGISEAALAGVDASLMAVCVPYGLYTTDDPVYEATMAQIEAKLYRPEGGVYRYLADTYYGGGEWILLAAWLGWSFANAGRVDVGRKIVEWIEAQAEPDGGLPEQIHRHLLAPEYLRIWQENWGPVACPLLWSHAMYIILTNVLKEAV